MAISGQKRSKPLVWPLASVLELLFSLHGCASPSSCSLRPQDGAGEDMAQED